MAADVQDPGNLGGLIRAAEAGGVTGVLVSARRRTPSRGRPSAGAWAARCACRSRPARHSTRSYVAPRRPGTRTVAAVPRGGRAPEAVDWSGSVTLLLGGEGRGLPAGLLTACDDLVTVPDGSARGITQCGDGRRDPHICGATAAVMSDSLFDDEPASRATEPGGHEATPLADRVRPRTLNELVGRITSSRPAGPCAT